MIRFYLIVATELLFSPLLYLWEEFKKLAGRFKTESTAFKKNSEGIDREVIFAVHEWAGYPYIRDKTIKYVSNTFTCGLKFHFDRLARYSGPYKLKKILTISDCSDQYIFALKQQNFYDPGFEIHPVLNQSMDFSGYAYVCKTFLNPDKEQIVFLTNSSVDSEIVPFINDYVGLFKADPDLGLLGISYSTKIYQTFIKNNFNPHLQSFFLVSRSSILERLLRENGGIFPGSSETYKLSIIRFGEAKITRMIQKMGYKVAIVTEDGQLYPFSKGGYWYNGFYRWKLPLGDYRLHVKHPNRIHKLTDKHREN